MGIRGNASSSESSSKLFSMFGWLSVWWAWTPVLYGLGWCLRLVTPGHRVMQSADQWLFANYLSFGGWFWVWLTIGLIGTVVIALVYLGESDRAKVAKVVVASIAALLAIATFTQTWRINWDNDKDFARYYDRSTVFYSPSLDTQAQNFPPSLYRLVHRATQGNGELAGSADVPGYVRQGVLPTTGWDPRISSYNGAVFAMSRTSGDMQNVSLSADTVAYLNTWRGQPARWSGILDGNGNGQGMGGVSEWNGSKVTTCPFNGQYGIDRSFNGSNMADMRDYLAQEYPSLRWTLSDVWGYCDGKQPIVVVPVTKIVKWMSRTVNTAAGVIIVQGDHGKTKLTYMASVQPGELPGPVYAQSLVDTQLDAASWAAGRRNKTDLGFGYEPTTSDAQGGNVSDYLLRDSRTGRLVTVTPLTLRSSTSQLFVAYAVSYADSVNNGSLNQLSIYVLSPGDPRQINVDNMEAEARNWLAQQQPGFISSGGHLLEFTPAGGNMWRAYGELNGRVVYLLDIDATGSVTPTLTAVSSFGGTSTPTGGAKASSSVCGKPLSTLTTAQIANCLRQFADYAAEHAAAGASK